MIHLETDDAIQQQAQMPPLEPVMLADSQQAYAKRTRQDAPETDRFNCSICYEYMEAPSSCGQCSGRFCKDCLTTVKLFFQGLCPICRRRIHRIEEDPDLSKEMDEIGTFPCRFEGCDSSLSLRQVKRHELEECRMICVVCHYEEFGCTWQGLRGNLQNHEEADCALANLEREMARRQAARSPSNPVDILSFVIQVACYSRFLIHSKAAWTNMYATSTARATVFTFLTLIPTYLLVARLVWVEFTNCISILRHPQFSLDSLDEETAEILLDSATTIVAFAVAASQIILSLQDDNQTSIEWEYYERQVRTVWCTTTIGFFLMHNLIFSMLDGFCLPTVLAIVLFTATLTLPTAIAAFSCKLAGFDRPFTIPIERVAVTFIYGLLLAFTVHMTDAISCSTAICLFGRLMHYVSHLCDNELGPPVLEIAIVALTPGLMCVSENDFGSAVNREAACAWLLVIFVFLAYICEKVVLSHVEVAFALRDDSADRKGNGNGLILLAVTVCSYVLLATISPSWRQWLS